MVPRSHCSPDQGPGELRVEIERGKKERTLRGHTLTPVIINSGPLGSKMRKLVNMSLS